jgi:exodeoxyribonuclease VII large subunit
VDVDERRLDRALPSLPALRSAVDGDRHAMTRALAARLEHAGTLLAGVDGRLAALSPLATLSRGYAIVQREKDGRVLTRAKDAKAKETVGIRLADGELRAEVIG